VRPAVVVTSRIRAMLTCATCSSKQPIMLAADRQGTPNFCAGLRAAHLISSSLRSVPKHAYTIDTGICSAGSAVPKPLPLWHVNWLASRGRSVVEWRFRLAHERRLSGRGRGRQS